MFHRSSLTSQIAGSGLSFFFCLAIRGSFVLIGSRMVIGRKDPFEIVSYGMSSIRYFHTSKLAIVLQRQVTLKRGSIPSLQKR
jgi:hypothetical protein